MFESGRFMPVYWFYHTLEYAIGGLNPTIHFLLHYLLILLAALFIYGTVKEFTNSEFAAFISGTLYIVTPLNTENLYRLGPQEPILSFLMAASIYFLIKNKLNISVVLLLLVALTKENGFILWIPFFILYILKKYLTKKKDANLSKFSLWGLLFSLPIVYNALFSRVGYSSNYTFDIGKIISNFTGYITLVSESFSPLFVIFIATFLIRIFISFQEKRKVEQMNLVYEATFLLIFLEFVAIMSPWKYFLGRYLMPSTVGLVIFIGLEIKGIKEFLEKFKFKYLNVLTAFFVGYFLFFASVNMVRVYVHGLQVAQSTAFIQSILKNLSKVVPENGLVLYNFEKSENTVEYVVQTGLQLGLFYDRSDVRADYFYSSSLPKDKYVIVGVSSISPSYAVSDIERTLGGPKKEEYIYPKKTLPILTNPMNMISQTVKKVYKFAANKIPMTAEGIVAFYQSNDSWYILSPTKDKQYE